MDGTTTCPSCGARVWVDRDVQNRIIQNQRCVCGHIFTPEDPEPFLTAAQKRAMQGEVSPTKGPQPVAKPKPKRKPRSKKTGG